MAAVYPPRVEQSQSEGRRHLEGDGAPVAELTKVEERQTLSYFKGDS